MYVLTNSSRFFFPFMNNNHSQVLLRSGHVALPRVATRMHFSTICDLGLLSSYTKDARIQIQQFLIFFFCNVFFPPFFLLPPHAN